MTKTKPMTDEWKGNLDYFVHGWLQEHGIEMSGVAYEKLEEAVGDIVAQATSKAREERTEEIRTKLVEFAIDGSKQPDELRGLDLYSKMLSYLKSLIQKDK